MTKSKNSSYFIDFCCRFTFLSPLSFSPCRSTFLRRFVLLLPAQFFICRFTFLWPLYFVFVTLVFLSPLQFFSLLQFFLLSLYFVVATLSFCCHLNSEENIKWQKKKKKKKKRRENDKSATKNMERLYMALLGFLNSVVLLFYFVNVSHFSLQVEFLKFKSSLFLT